MDIPPPCTENASSFLPVFEAITGPYINYKRFFPWTTVSKLKDTIYHMYTVWLSDSLANENLSFVSPGPVIRQYSHQ